MPLLLYLNKEVDYEKVYCTRDFIISVAYFTCLRRG